MRPRLGVRLDPLHSPCCGRPYETCIQVIRIHLGVPSRQLRHLIAVVEGWGPSGQPSNTTGPVCILPGRLVGVGFMVLSLGHRQRQVTPSGTTSVIGEQCLCLLSTPMTVASKGTVVIGAATSRSYVNLLATTRGTVLGSWDGGASQSRSPQPSI